MSKSALLTTSPAGSQPTGDSSQPPDERFQSVTTAATAVSSKEQPGPQEPPPRSSAPSPAPTEIIPLDLTQDEIVEEIQKMGIKVRDFAYENVPTSQRAIELFDPLQAWYTYETAFTIPAIMRIAFPGKLTRRLLDIGWLTREEEEGRWTCKDSEALESYDKRAHYPWRPFKLPQPNLESLTHAWRTRFEELTGDEPPPPVSRPFISRYRGFRFGEMADRKRGVTDEREVTNGDVSPQTKKPRLEDPAAESSEPLPSQPPVLINGRPPQQFPAGNPADT
ncbi:hypothetical protein K503DRAFT_805737 [Rhizopogon vinicolor AM-OR11-026]|uniref:Uncharacterized protein n=1 Tax=Rhizopogon vinicolor AM-OR11-026 TaxID=1314800 RepID=A0A1B7MGV7_9AGAM|nr:hypothetical protein K503DRAFT_805737 [Rhizopogon vinicolor AM-OR11-026]